MTENENITKKFIEIYNVVADKYGISSKAVLWDDQQTQYLRFSELTGNLDLNDKNKTLLDVGCGNGELYRFLNFRGFRGHYTGCDINEKLLAQARRRFPKINFQNRDIMIEEIGQRFDYVVMSGLFNMNVGQSLGWVYDFVKQMYVLCNEITVFNAISTYVNYKDDKMFYVHPSEALSFCIDNLSKRVTLAHHNLPYNYTITIFKNDKWDSASSTE